MLLNPTMYAHSATALKTTVRLSDPVAVAPARRYRSKRHSPMSSGDQIVRLCSQSYTRMLPAKPSAQSVAKVFTQTRQPRPSSSWPMPSTQTALTLMTPLGIGRPGRCSRSN